MLATHPRASSLALALAASASLVYAHAHSRRSHTPAPDTPTTPTPTTTRPPTQDKKCFLTKREFFDPQTSRFIDEHSDSDSDSDDGDDDDDGSKGADDQDTQKKKKTKKPKYLFTASSRTYPRSPDFAGYQGAFPLLPPPSLTPRTDAAPFPARTDYVALSLHASPLIAALRAVPALASTESVFDDKPDLDARDLFLVRDDVRAFVRELEDEARRVRASEDDEGGAHDEDGKTDVAATQATTDAHPLVVQPEKKSADALELEAEQVGVLLDYLDDSFKATCVFFSNLALRANDTDGLHLQASQAPAPAPPALSSRSSRLVHLVLLRAPDLGGDHRDACACADLVAAPVGAVQARVARRRRARDVGREVRVPRKVEQLSVVLSFFPFFCLSRRDTYLQETAIDRPDEPRRHGLYPVWPDHHVERRQVCALVGRRARAQGATLSLRTLVRALSFCTHAPSPPSTLAVQGSPAPLVPLARAARPLVDPARRPLLARPALHDADGRRAP